MSYNGNNNNSFPRKRGFGPRGAHGKGIFRSRFLHPPLRHVAPPPRHGQPRPLGWKLNNVFYPPFRGNPKFRPHNGRGRGIGNIRFPPPHRLPAPPNYMFEDDIILDENEESHVNSTPLLPLPGSEEERQLKITEAADRLKQKLSFSKDKEHNIQNDEDVPDPLDDDCLRNNQSDFDVTCNELTDIRNINPDNLRPDIIQHHDAEAEELADCRRNDVTLNENEHGSQLEEANDQVRNLEDFSGYEVIDRWECDESVDNSCNLEQSTLYQESNIVESRSLDLNLQCQYDVSLTDNVQDQCNQQQNISQDVSHEVPQDILQDVSQDIPQDIPQDIHSQNVFCQDVSQDTFQNVSEENQVHPTDAMIEQNESETLNVQGVSFLPNPIDQNILQDEQEEPAPNPEDREDAPSFCVYPEKSGNDCALPDCTLPDCTLPDCTLPDCTLPDCTLPQSEQVDISVLNDVTLDNQSPEIHENSFHSGPPNLSPPVDTAELELPADFDPTTPPPILLKQDQPHALPLPLELPPLFNPAEPPPNMRHLIGPTTSPCDNMNHPWNINNQNPIPYNTELNVHVGFTSPMSFEMASPNNVYLSPIVSANNFSSFVPMMPNNHPAINTNIPPVMQSHVQMAPQLQVVPFAHLTEPSVPPPPPEDSSSKDDGLNDMEEAMKFAEQMTILTASKPERSESSSLIESSSVNVISNIETIELPPEKPKTKSKKLKRKTLDDTKVPEEKTPSKHSPSVETTTLDATERAKDTSLIPDDHRPKVVFNLNNTSKLVRSTVTRQQESVNETANNRKSSIQSVESKRAQSRPSASDRNLENTKQNKESNRNSKKPENKPDVSKVMASPSVVSPRKKKQENAYAEKPSGVTSGSSLKSRVADQDESNKSSISDVAWKNKVINRLLKMSTNEIYNLVNNTSLRKFNVVMKRLVKEKKSTLSLEKRHEQDEKMKMYDRQEFIKHLNAMLDTDAVVSVTDLPTEFIQHLNEVLQMNMQQTDFQAEPAAAAATSGGQSGHSDAANYVSNPPARVAEHAVNRTALSVNDVGQECARIKSDAKTRYSARGAKARNCKSNNSTNLRIDTPPNSSSARTHAIKNNDVTSSTRTDVAAARVQDVIRNNNNVNPQQNDTSSVVASSSDSICNNLLSLQHDVDDIFSEVTKKYQQPAGKKKRARCSTSDDGTIFVRAQDNIFEQSLTRNTENCIRWLEGCDRWKRKEREEPRYRNLTREEWLAKYGTQANPPSSPVTTTTSTTTTLPTTTLPTTATDTARFAQLSKQQTKKYPLQRRYSSESLRFNARQSRSLERDKQTQPRRHSDERRQVATECSENDRGNNNSSSSSSSDSSSDSGKSNDNNNTNVAKLLRVIKEKEKVAKKRSLNEQMRDEINAEIEQERKKRAKKSRKKNSKHRREKRLRHKKKKTKKTRSFTTSSGSDGDSDAEELPTRLLTADEIKKEMDDQVTPQQVMIKEEVDIGQDENIETAFANAAVGGNAIPISENRATCLSSSRNSRFDSPATRENPAVTINTVQLLVAEDRRLQTTPASPTTKTKAQLKQMPETSYRNEGGKIRPNVFTSVPRDTISAANLAANLDRPCPAPPAPVVCDDNNKIDAPSTSIANPVGRNADNNAQEPVKNATEKLLLPEARAPDRRDEKHEEAPTTSESPTAAINAEDDNNKKCQPTISVSTADVSSAEAPSTVSIDASAADAASQKSSKKIDLKTYYERTIRRRISEQSKKRNVKNESSENPNAETSQLSAATTIPQRDVPSKSKRAAPETKAAPTTTTTTAKKSKSPSDASKKFVNIRSEGSKELRLKRLSPIKKGKKKTTSKCASTNPVVSTDVNPPSQTTETTEDTTRTEDAGKMLGGEKEIDNTNHGNRVNSTNNNNVNDNVDKVEVTASNIDSSVAINELSTKNCLDKNIDNIDDRKLSRNSDEDKPEECSETNKENNTVEQRNVEDAGDIVENSDTREQVTAFAETAMREEKTTRAGNANRRAASSGEVADGATRKDDDASLPTTTTTTTTTEPNVSKPPQKYPRKLKRRNFIPSSQVQIEKSNDQADTTENKNATTPPPRSTCDIDSQNKENRELTSASATSNKEVGNAKSPIISKDATTCKPASKNETNSLLKKAIKMSINSSENNLQEHHQGATSAENEISSPESLASNSFKGFLQEPVMDFEQSGLFNFSLNEIDADKSKLFLHENSINSIVTQTVNSTMMKLEQPRENYDEMPTDYTEDVDIGTGENFNIGFGDTLLAADKECATGTDEKPDALTVADECGEEEPAIKSPSEIVVGAASLHDEENTDANSSSETEKQLKECLSTTSMFANDVENDEELIRDASGIKNLKSKLKTATDPSLSDALDTAAVSDDNMRLTETQSADHLNNPMYLETDASSEKTCDKLPDFDSDAQLDNMFYLDERLPSATEFDNKDDASYPVHPPSPPQYGLVPAVIPEMTTITSCGGMLSPEEVRKTERYNLKPADNDLMIGAPAGHSPAGAEETRTSSVIPTKAALKEVATNDFPRSSPSNLSAERAALEMFEKGATSGGEEEEEDVAPNYQTSALPAWHVSETNTDTRETHNNTDFVNINMVSSTGNRDKIDECARKKTSVNTASESTPTLSVNVVADKLFNLQRKPVVELTKMKEVESLLQKKVVGRHEKKCGSKEQREERHKRAADSALHRLKDKLSMKNRSEKTSEDNLLKKLKDMMRKSKTRGTNVRETILARMLEIDMKMHNLMLEKLKLHELLHDKNALTMRVNDASHSVANNTASVTPVTSENNNNNNNNNAASVQSGTSPARPITQLSPNAETTTNRAKQDKYSSTSLSRRSSSKQRKRNVSHSSEEDEIANFAHKSKMPVIKWKKKPRLELNSSRRREDNNDDEDDNENKEKEKIDAKTERRVAATSFSQKKAVDDPVDKSKNNNRVSESDSVLDRGARKPQEAAAKTDDVDKPSTCAVSKTTQPDKTYAENRSDRQNSVERETEHMDVEKRSETRTPSECAKTSSRPSSRQVHSTPEPIYSDDSTWDSMVQNIVSETHENRKTISPLVLLDESLKKEMAKARKMKAMMRKKKKKQLNNFLNSVNSLTEEEEELPLSILYIRKLQQKRDLLDSLSDKKKDVDTKDRAKNVDDATNAAQTDKAPENPQEDPPPPPPPLPQPQEARAPDEISTSNVSSVLQPSHQFCIDAEANANSDWPSPEKENVGEVAPQDNNDANSSSDYVFRSVSQNRVTFQDERNMEPDSSVTPEDTLIEKHSTDNVESIENSRTRSGSIARDDRSKDRNKIPDIKVSVPKTLIDDDFSVRLLQKFKETETGVDSTSSSAPPASAEKVEEINKQSENISETETKSVENDKSEEAKDTGLIEDDKDKNDEDPAKDLSPAVEENNTCALQEKETIDEGAKDVPPVVQLAKLDYSEPEKETSSTDSIKSNDEKITTTDAARAEHSHNTDAVMEKAEQKKSDAESEQSSNDAIASKRDDQITEIATAEQEERINSDNIRASPEKIVSENSGDIVPADRASEKETNESADTLVEPKSSLESTSASSLKETEKSEETSKKLRRKHAKSTPTRRSHRHISENVKLTRTGSTESSESKGKTSRRKRKHTEWQMMNCKVKVIDCKYTFLRPNVSSKLLEKYGIIHVNSYPSDSYKLPAQRAMSYGDHPALISEDDSSQSAFCDKDITELEILEEKFIKKTSDINLVQEPTSHAAVNDDQREPMRIQYSDHTGPILDIKVFENSFLAASEDGKIYRYSRTTDRILNIYKGHKSAVTCLHINTDAMNKKFVYSGSLDGNLRCYNIMTGELVKNSVQINSPIQCMDEAWGLIFIGTKSGHVSRFNIKTGCVKGSSIQFSEMSVLALKATNEGPRRILIVASRSQPITIRDAQTGLFLRTISSQKNHTVYSLMRHQSLIYCGTSSTSINVFDFTTGEQTIQYKAGVGIVCMRLHKQLLFAGCYDGNIYIFDTRNHKLVCTIPGPGNMLLSIEVIDNKIIAGSKDKRLHLWQMPTEVCALL